MVRAPAGPLLPLLALWPDPASLCESCRSCYLPWPHISGQLQLSRPAEPTKIGLPPLSSLFFRLACSGLADGSVRALRAAPSVFVQVAPRTSEPGQQQLRSFLGPGRATNQGQLYPRAAHQDNMADAVRSVTSLERSVLCRSIPGFCTGLCSWREMARGHEFLIAGPNSRPCPFPGSSQAVHLLPPLLG